VHTALCLGEHNETLHISLRTDFGQDAGLIIQKVVLPPGKAGGHGNMAGGQVPLAEQDIEQLLVSIEKRFLEIMGESSEGLELL
jgi:nanoRNase/pAp phosphatase (c-di-AMP/oligoRNAs hydrolase)